MDNDKKELCSIRVMFPVASDEDAIKAKHKLQEALADIPDVNIQFSISNIALRPHA